MPHSLKLSRRSAVLAGAFAPVAWRGITFAQDDTRTITDLFGEVTIPKNPERIAALDEVAGLTLLSLGLRPTIVFQTWGSIETGNLLRANDVEVIDVISATYLPEPEQVAKYEPDMIVSTATAIWEGLTEDFKDIAPVVHMPSELPWREVVAKYGEFFGYEEQTGHMISRLDEKIAGVRAQQPEPPLSLTIIMGSPQGGTAFVTDSTNALNSVLEEAGFTRPEADLLDPETASFGGWVPISGEMLPDHDADIVVLTGQNYSSDETIVTSMPLYPTLKAVESGQTPIVAPDFWGAGSAFTVFWMVSDLENFVVGDFSALSSEDAPQVWNEFVEFIG